MDQYYKFLNQIRQLNIEVNEYRFLKGVDWIKVSDLPKDFPKDLKKEYKWNLKPSDEDELKRLQSNAISELSFSTDEQMQKQLKRLDFINQFDRFFEFFRNFYVKYENNQYSGIDISDFKLKMESCFYCNIPEKGNFDIYFLDNLMEDLIIKSAIFDGLKYQLEQLAPQQKIIRKKPGRQNANIKEAKEYLSKFDLQENKEKFLIELRKEYSNTPPKTFNHLMTALNEMGFLKVATKNEYRLAFEKALDREAQSKQNFNSQFGNLKNVDPLFYKSIKSRIEDIIQSEALA